VALILAICARAKSMGGAPALRAWILDTHSVFSTSRTLDGDENTYKTRCATLTLQPVQMIVHSGFHSRKIFLATPLDLGRCFDESADGTP
jgi:hypothetical protein